MEIISQLLTMESKLSKDSYYLILSRITLCMNNEIFRHLISVFAVERPDQSTMTALGKPGLGLLVRQETGSLGNLCRPCCLKRNNEFMSHTQVILTGSLRTWEQIYQPKDIPVISHTYPVDVHHPDRNTKHQVQDLKDPKA